MHGVGLRDGAPFCIEKGGVRRVAVSRNCDGRLVTHLFFPWVDSVIAKKNGLARLIDDLGLTVSA